MQFKKICLLLFFSLVLLFSSCTKEGTDDPTNREVAPLILAGENASVYTIVRSEYADTQEMQVIRMVRDYLKSRGVEMKITTDWKDNPVSEYEIVIGKTEREGMPVDPLELGEEGWCTAVFGSRIFLYAQTVESEALAAEHFLRTFCGYPDAEGTAAGTISVPGDYLYLSGQTYDIADITVSGHSLRDFSLAKAENGFGSDSLFRSIQTKLYKHTGIWLPISDTGENPKKSSIITQTSADSMLFQAVWEEDALVLRAADEETLLLGWNRLLQAAMNGQNGVVSLDAHLPFTVDSTSYITYRDFGATGDGETNDMDAIAAAHAYANKHNLPVRGTEGDTYRIVSAGSGAVIETDTDWTGCSFLIDDAAVSIGERNGFVFTVQSKLEKIALKDRVSSLTAETATLGISLPSDAVVVIENANVRQFIRSGSNKNSGKTQKEAILVSANGTVAEDTPLVWDYETVTDAYALPVDPEPLTLRGGTFTTLANTAATGTNYWYRGISVNRSNVCIEGLTHYVKGEDSHGAPYSGFLRMSFCADITVRDCQFSPHYNYNNSGSYDIYAQYVLRLTLKNCTQNKGILNTEYWGIYASDQCKSVLWENCTLSRFDAHEGVWNATLRGCTLGHQCLNAVGGGTLLVEDTTFYGQNMINLRSDYGSLWDGEIILRRCVWIPNCGKGLNGVSAVVRAENTCQNDYGYACCMPHTLIIEGLSVQDKLRLQDGSGVYLFSDFIPGCIDASYSQMCTPYYPYDAPKEVRIIGYSAESGKLWSLCPNEFIVRETKVLG